MPGNMRPASESESLKDPVCGRLVGASSAHRHLHHDAVFCFCSVRCRDLFAAQPSRYIVFSLPAGSRDADPKGPPEQNFAPSYYEGLTYADIPRPVQPSKDAPPVMLDTEDFTATNLLVRAPVPPTMPAAPGAQPRPAAAPAQARTAVRLPPTARAPDAGQTAAPAHVPATGSGKAGWLARLAALLPWHEQRFARRVSRQLLQLHQSVSARNKRLWGRDLYRQIVIAREGVDSASADALLDRAEQSYAKWPVPRALMFRDVVHMITVSEFLESHGESAWIHENLRQEIDALIPKHL